MKSTEFIAKNPELFSKAQECKSLDEFLKLAKENNVEFEDISLEEAYSFLNGKQELDDDLLDNVAGGKGDEEETTPYGYPTKTYTKSVGLEKNDLIKDPSTGAIRFDEGDFQPVQ